MRRGNPGIIIMILISGLLRLMPRNDTYHQRIHIMLEKYLRAYYQKFCIAPIVKYFNNISTNTVSIAACMIGIAIIPALINHFTFLAVALLLISGYLDTLDGTLARIKDIKSSFGTALDIVGDRIVEFSVILGLYGYAPESRGWLSLIMLGSILICVTTFLIVGIFMPNDSQKSFHYSPGLIERPEAFVFFILMLLFPQWFSFLAILFTILVLLTGAIRSLQFYKFSTSLKQIANNVVD